MPISLLQLADILRKHASAGDHTVIVDGEDKGKCCTHASFRMVFSFSGVEFPVDYAYSLDGQTHTFRSRLRREGIGSGGREQIMVDGKDVDDDDVIVGSSSIDGMPAVHVEFRYSDQGKPHSVIFAAPVSAFH